MIRSLFLKSKQWMQILREQSYEYLRLPSLIPYTDKANELYKNINQQVGGIGSIFTIQ